MMSILKAIASLFGVGYIRGGGTVAALLYCLLWVLCSVHQLSVWIQLIMVIVILLIGIVASAFVEKDWGHDSNRIVIDEVSGMSIALFLVPGNIYYVIAAFLLFRFFDILKPFFIRRAEKMPGGAGVMMDDVLAGIYSSVLLQLLILTVE